MNKYPWWKYLIILAVIAFGIIYSVPNLFPDDVAVQISAHTGYTMDQATIDTVKKTLSSHNISYKSITKQDEHTLLIRFKTAEEQLRANDLLKTNLGDNYTVALNLASSTPYWMTDIGANPMKLGLDLRGGVHFLLAIDVESLMKRRINGDVRSIGSELRNKRVRYRGLTMQDNVITINFKKDDDLNKAVTIIKQNFPELQLKINRSEGNESIRAQMSPEAKLKSQNYAVDQTTTILRNRINELGIAEPIVQRQGAERIAVDLPGVQDTARAKQILGGTATLEFHLVDVEHDPSQAKTSGAPFGTKLYVYEDRPYLLKTQSILSGTSITGASSTIGHDGRPSVDIRLGGGGEAMFYRITSENVGKPLSIVYVETKMQAKKDAGKVTYIPRKTEKVINIATIQSALGNNFQITGLTDAREARNLALLLRAGALPAPISIIEESTVGPSMGRSNIDKGLLSLELGMIFIVVFMAIYYRLFGFFADIALMFNLLLLVAILSILGMTLTLPGIAGIVLSVGMAIDANVLIFERIREELRNGMSPQAAIKAGYERAFATIVDSNVTTLIAGAALFGIATGAIRGFAVTLCIGLMCSMFTTITGTRAIVNLTYGTRSVKKLSIGI